MNQPYKIELTASIGDYDLHRSLLLGEIEPAGINLSIIPTKAPERHYRMLCHQEFDIAELSLSSYLILKSRNLLPFTAIPIFPHRRFRHSYILINPNKGLKHPKDLEGKRIGLRTWQTTMSVWVRGILQEEYGVDIRSIDWLTQDAEDLPIDPQGFRLKQVDEGENLVRMLQRGEIDALIYPEFPQTFLAGDSNIQRLFPEYKQAEMQYYAKTGIFPIMHTVVIKDSVLEKYPWVAGNLVQAFNKSKQNAWKRMEDPRTISLGWLVDLIEEQQNLLGRDPWENGITEKNRKNLNTLIGYSLDQGMMKKNMAIEELFYPATLNEIPSYI